MTHAKALLAVEGNIPKSARRVQRVQINMMDVFRIANESNIS